MLDESKAEQPHNVNPPMKSIQSETSKNDNTAVQKSKRKRRGKSKKLNSREEPMESVSTPAESDRSPLPGKIASPAGSASDAVTIQTGPTLSKRQMRRRRDRERRARKAAEAAEGAAKGKQAETVEDRGE